MTNLLRRIWRSVLFLVYFFSIAVFVQGCTPDSHQQPESGPFTYQPDSSLTRAEQNTETRFARAIRENLNVFVAAYRWQWLKVINTDNARELFHDYAPDGIDVQSETNTKYRTRNALGTQSPARALAMEVYRRMLEEAPRDGEQPLVVFTAGGAGSGKSTSVNAIPQLEQSVQKAQIVVDTTLSSEGALDQIQMALDAGKSVTIYYIYRDPESAFESVLERASGTGRPVTVSNFIATHLGALDAVNVIGERFRQHIVDENIKIIVVNNTGEFGKANIETDGITFLQNQIKSQDREVLEKKFKARLKEHYENGQITEILFNKSNR